MYCRGEEKNGQIIPQERLCFHLCRTDELQERDMTARREAMFLHLLHHVLLVHRQYLLHPSEMLVEPQQYKTSRQCMLVCRLQCDEFSPLFECLDSIHLACHLALRCLRLNHCLLVDRIP